LPIAAVSLFSAFRQFFFFFIFSHWPFRHFFPSPLSIFFPFFIFRARLPDIFAIDAISRRVFHAASRRRYFQLPCRILLHAIFDSFAASSFSFFDAQMPRFHFSLLAFSSARFIFSREYFQPLPDILSLAIFAIGFHHFFRERISPPRHFILLNKIATCFIF